MKSQYLLTTIIISSLILFVISGATLAFADHPNLSDLTFDKESYEYGDTMYITAQMYEPFMSDEGERNSYLALALEDLDPIRAPVIQVDVSETGITLLNYTFNKQNYEKGEFFIKSQLVMFYTDRIDYGGHFGSVEPTLTLSSDIYSTTTKHINDIKTHNSTLAEHDDTLLSMNVTLDEYDTIMYELQNTIQSQNTTITTLQSELNIIVELLDELLNPIPVKDPIGIMPILPQPIIEHPIDEIPPKLQRPTISNLTGILYTNGTAILSWDITTDSVNQYKIKYISEDKKVKKVTIRDSAITSYTVHNLQQEQYDFTLRAWTDAGKTNLAKVTIYPVL